MTVISMIKRHSVFFLLFLLIFSANIIAELGYVSDLNLFVKPLICISLAVYFCKSLDIKSGFNRFILAGLLFSLAGDCFLLFDNGTNFMLGLFSFLIAHIMYSLAFLRDFKNDPQASKKYGHLMFFLMGVFSLTYYSAIRQFLQELRIPVMLYMFVISMMAILAGYRYRRVNALSFNLIYTGAILFVISDSVLAYDKFVSPKPFSGIIIMATYMAAQFLITMGAIERKVTTNLTDPI